MKAIDADHDRADARGVGGFTAASWDALLRPRSIALVGASPNNEFHACLMGNVEQFGYAGRLLPVNPSRSEVFGLPCFPTVSAIEEPVDLVAVSVPASRAEAVVADALAAGARSFVMHTAGLGETGGEGREIERRIVELCRSAGVTLIGPNGLGLLSLHAAVPTFGATFGPGLVPGEIGLIAQSGSVVCALLETGRDLGFSVVASTGNEAVVTAEDLMEVLLDDDDTKVIAFFLEGLRDGRRFRRLMERAHALGKPVVALHVGSSPQSKDVMATHTGRLAGDDRIVRSVFRDLGVLTASDYDQMVETLYLVSRTRGRRVGRRLAVVSPSGGELSMVADALHAEGLTVAELADETTAAIAAALDIPADRPVTGLFDVAGTPNDGTAETLEEHHAAVTLALAGDPSVDTVLVVQDWHEATSDGLIEWNLPGCRGVGRAAQTTTKPVVTMSLLTADIHPRLQACLDEAGLPVVRGLGPGLHALSQAARRPVERPVVDLTATATAASVERWAMRLADEGRAPNERDVKALLTEHGIPVVEDRLCSTAQEAVSAAEALGYPVVLKVVSGEILHKSEVGGVRLGLATAGAVAQAFDAIVEAVSNAAPGADVRGVMVAPQVPRDCELVVGGLVDPTYGPMVMVGLGGVFVEVLEEVAFGLAPTTPEAAAGLLAQTKADRLLDGFRGSEPVDRRVVADVVARVGALIAAGAGVIESIEINPLVAHGSSVTALDARVTLVQARASSDATSDAR